MQPHPAPLGLTLVLSALACSPSEGTHLVEAASRAPLAAPPDRPTLEYVRTELRQYGSEPDPYYRFMDIVRFTNPTGVAFEFEGERITWPYWSRLVRDEDGGWSHQPTFRCLTEMTLCRIEPGESVEFPAHSTRSTVGPREGGLSRVGLRVTDTSTGAELEIWTEPFLPSTTDVDEARARELDPFGHRR